MTTQYVIPRIALMHNAWADARGGGGYAIVVYGVYSGVLGMHASRGFRGMPPSKKVSFMYKLHNFRDYDALTFICISYLMDILCLWSIYHECPEGMSCYIGQ